MRSLRLPGARLVLLCAFTLAAAAFPYAPTHAATINVPADHATIVAAVSAAAPYDTVMVAAGNYPEQITVNKPLTLLGPNAGISPNTGTRVAEAVISTAVNHGFILTSTGTSLSDVKISGFQFDAITSQCIRAVNDDFFDIEISYNLFTNVGIYAFLTLGGTPVTKNGATHGGTRQNWVIHDNRIDSYTAASAYGFLFSNVWNESLVFTNNVIHDATGLGAGRGAFIEGLSFGTISGNTFIGQNRYGLILQEGAEDVDVVGNTFTGCVRGMVIASAADGSGNPHTIDNVLISANQFTDLTNIAIDFLKTSAGAGHIGNVNIEGNTFTQDVSLLTAAVAFIEVKLDSAYLAGPIIVTENTFTHFGTYAAGAAHAYGIRIRGGGVGTFNIERNDFDGGGVTGSLTSGVYVKTLIDAYGLIQPGATINVSENVITGYTHAIITRSAVFGDLPAGVDLLVHGNSLTGNGGGVANDGNPIELVNASANWWGTTDPLAIAGLAGDGVDWTPYLLSGVDTDLVTPGFQGDFSDLQVDATSLQHGATSRVQEGVDLADGSVVHLSAGVFTEQVEVSKDVELAGAGVGTTIIASPATLNSSFPTGPNNNFPVVYVHDAADVRIHDLTVDGSGLGNANYRFIGIGYHNAGGVVTDCDILEIRNEPIDGSQHGVALYALAEDGTPRTLDISGCGISGFQKNGMALSGADLTATVDGNTVTGAGAVGFIAQNGIQLGFGAIGSITNNTVTGFSYEPATFASAGILVYSAVGAVPTTDNVVNECQIGVWYIASEGAIHLNQVTNTPAAMGTTPTWWCIVADPGVGTLRQPPPHVLDLEWLTMAAPRALGAEASAFATTAYRNTIDGGGKGVGIEADALGTEVLSFTATENDVSNCQTGFVLYSDPGAVLNASVQFNRIEGNVVGLDNQSLTSQEAIVNWWGVATGPRVATNPGGGDSVTANVTYSPWLSYPDDDPGTPGYQIPAVMNWQINATTPLVLSKSVGFASDGDTLSIHAGDYIDNVIVDKSLALLGADASQVTLFPLFADTSAPEPPSLRGSQLLVIRAHDVVIDHLTLDGDSPTLSPIGVIDARNGIITDFNNMGNWSNLTVTNCVIRNIYWRALFIFANTSTTGHVIRDNTIEHVRGGAQSAAIMLGGATAEIVGNVVSDASIGIALWPGTTGSQTGGRADSNTVANCDLGITASRINVPLQLRDNTVSDAGTGAGIQLLSPLVPIDVLFNTITGCDTGLVIHGGLVNATVEVQDNSITDGPSFPSFGIYTSTSVGDTAHMDVDAHLRRNAISGNSFGIFLNEDPLRTDRRTRVVISGAPADSNQIGNNTVMEIFLANCDDSINAQHNLWFVDCGEIEDHVYHQFDDPSLGWVDFSNAFCTACEVDITGDADTTGAITSSDIIYLVNFVFKGGPDPLPIADAGDVNCSGEVNSSDVIYLVNFVFKGGPTPCDVCSIL